VHKASKLNDPRPADQWIKEAKQAVKLTRLSCHRFRADELWLRLSLIAFNLGFHGGGSCRFRRRNSENAVGRKSALYAPRASGTIHPVNDIVEK
jgi:hypothetical protein